MIVAITGGTGFIGRHLIARHISRGDQVRYLTRKDPRTSMRGAVAHVGSLRSPISELRKFVRNADVLYHCAAELKDESQMENTNVLGTANLLAAAAGEVGRWIQLSSTGVYGGDLHGEIHEDSDIKPVNAYERSKSMSDKLVCEAADDQNLPLVLLRPSNVYGADMPNQSLFHLIRTIDRGMFFFIGSHGPVANYVHVENVVDALMLCQMVNLPSNGRTYIVSDHRTLETFVRIISGALGKNTPRKRLPEFLARAVVLLAGAIPKFPLTASRVDALINRTVYRTDRIESELGYKSRISMEQGIGDLVRKWKNGSTQG